MESPVLVSICVTPRKEIASRALSNASTTTYVRGDCQISKILEHSRTPTEPLLSEYGTYQTVTAKVWPCLSLDGVPSVGVDLRDPQERNRVARVFERVHHQMRGHIRQSWSDIWHM